MAMKIRSGLYKVVKVIDLHNTCEFTIEYNTGDYDTRDLGMWLVTQEINGEPELWDNDFATKKQALLAIEDQMLNGKYKKTKYGWAYFPNSKE